MRVLIALAVLLNLPSVPAGAAWQVHTSTDRMTDRPVTDASLRVPGATLHLHCEMGPTIRVDAPLPPRSDIGVNYRFDQRALVPRMVFVSTDGRNLRPWMGAPRAGLQAVARAKRLRLEIFGPSGVQFLDFDLTGAREALAKACP